MPPTISVSDRPLAEAAADALVVGVFAPPTGQRADPVDPSPAAGRVAAALEIDLVAELGAAGFDGSVGSVSVLANRGRLTAPTTIVVGLGARNELGHRALCRAAAAAAKAAVERHRHLAVDLPGDETGMAVEAAAHAVAEGLLLGAYRFDTYRSEPRPVALEVADLHVTAEAEAAERGVKRARATAGGAMVARDLVNVPPQDKRPPELADRAVALVDGLPIDVRVFDEEALADGGYGGILGVGQGSSSPPRLVELRYRPADARKHVALIGKGITFDTGGLSLKPSASMETMKSDMAGAATVLGAIRAVAELGLPIEVTALLALAENMPSGSATRVSDVLRMKDGTTVEVINTDAEGRLVLGDAIAHAVELEPDVVVDVATLTGAAVVALGDRIGVVIANDDALAEELVGAGTATGEPLWRLPLARDEYGERVEGNIADLKNAGDRKAGTIFGALFLARFVPEAMSWAHLDVAGTAWADEAYGEYAKGGTGVPVRTLLRWLDAR